MTKLKAIQDKIAKLQAQAEAIVRNESAALKKILALMDRHGLTTDDIAVGFRKPAARRKLTTVKAPTTLPAAKYLDPKTGATWTGRGRPPAWIANAKDRSEFLVERAKASPAAAKKTPKSGNNAHRPQTLLYRDPQSGSTWNGRGRVPAWLAAAADPIRFLIETERAFPEKGERTPAMECAKKAKQAGRTTKGEQENDGVVRRQTNSEEIRDRKEDCERGSWSLTKNAAAQMVSVRQAPRENVVAERASVVNASVQAAEQGIAKELAA
ncbi:H-NS family nucleoid-associated regulatory protein [Caballeronia sp. J97]|uniref:H-NS family nucleoid-associated regulatory protein n=1 Tax=Caballeronia sp. J97 TaxID=2805429 RepID=UPI002AB1AED2|nr:H-NS family nucleoid-associated regulatory protein [Caballeronia sp. J97]